jgi:DNA repair protein RecO (recombination protein O)
MIRTFKTEAIIIKRKNIGEADKILTVFSKDLGKLTIKAKGIRRVPSRRSAHVEPLNIVSLTLYAGPSKSPTLTEATAIETFSDLKADLQKIGFAYHLCELIDGLCPENQEHRDIYFLLKQTLGRFGVCHSEGTNQSSDTLLSVVHDFEVELLTLLGYWHRPSETSKSIDMHSFIESILERRLKSKRVFQQ